MLKMFGDSAFHLSVIAAIIVCGVSYKYYQTHSAERGSSGPNGQQHQAQPSSVEEGAPRDLIELDEEELMRYLDELDVDQEGEAEAAELEDYITTEHVRDANEDVFARSASHVNPPPAAMAAASGSSSRSNKPRNLGKKKARSMERRDRIRQYNEYVRQIANAEREAQREFEEMYGDLIQEAKEAREAREKEAGQKLKDQREEKRKQEEAAQELKRVTRENLEAELQSNGRARLSTTEQYQLAAHIPDSVIVGEGEWLIRLRDADIKQVAKALQKKGSIDYKEMADLLSSRFS